MTWSNVLYFKQMRGDKVMLLDKVKLKSLLKDLLGEEYVTHLLIDLPQIHQVQIFIKTKDEFIWGERFEDEEDVVWNYLESLGYTDIDLVASTAIQGGVWSA